MALAPYFHKALQAVTTLAAGHDPQALCDKLERQQVGVAFDARASASGDAVTAIELTVDLLSRLYPRIALIDVDGLSPTLLGKVAAIARAANPAIEIANQPLAGMSITLVFGQSDVAGAERQLFAGANGWNCSLSTRPVASGHTGNPFGAGAVACIAAANVFRAAFFEELRNPGLDSSLSLNARDLAIASADATIESPLDHPIDLGETFLVGLGAIGHGVVWALERVNSLTGTLHLIDDEDYDASNPQRYAFTGANLAGSKVEHCARRLRSAHRNATISCHVATWDQYLFERNDWKLNRVAVALDSAEDRRLVQGSLPQVLLNAWTQPGNLGVSRHRFSETACLACLYAPQGIVESQDVVVARNLRFPAGEEALRDVRRLLVTGDSLSRALVGQIENQLGLPAGSLKDFVSKPLIDLYQDAACAGLVLRLGGNLGGSDVQAEVPMAFQSAMAGILLALEIVCDASPLRPSQLPVRSEINLLKPIKGTLNSPAQRWDKCICHDQAYLNAFRDKYASPSDPPVGLSG